MNLRTASICLDCDEIIDLSVSRIPEEEKCPRCGSKDHTMLSKYIKSMPVIRVIEKPAKKIGKRCRKSAQQTKPAIVLSCI
jgi:hypothetical protein